MRQRINAVVQWTVATDYGDDNACDRRGPMSRSTTFIQELEVGVKCMWNRGCFFNHRTTFACLCVQ